MRSDRATKLLDALLIVSAGLWVALLLGLVVLVWKASFS